MFDLVGRNQSAEPDVAALERAIREDRRRRVAELLPQERSWRLWPGDGGDPTEVSALAMAREIRLERAARRSLADRGRAGDAEAVAAAKRELKHFPVLFVSAPHLEDSVSGTFPGTPTPLLFATAVLDRYLAIDEFPAERVPEVVGVMNPALFTQEFRDELVASVSQHRPRLVGISNLSEGHYFALEIARLVKEASPESIVVLGGQHEDGTNPIVYRRAAESATTLPGYRAQLYALPEDSLRAAERHQTLAEPEEREFVDFVAAGEGPFLLLQLLEILAQRPEATADDLKLMVREQRHRFAEQPGSGALFFTRDGEIESVELSGRPIDGNQVPFIELRHLSHENRFPVFDNKKTAQVMACLGCKYACSFCHESADHFLYGIPKLLQRTPENVMHELALRAAQGFEAVFFDDSTFTQNRRWVDALLDQLLSGGLGDAQLEWGCQTTINDLTPQLLARMAQAGCTYIYFGVESARPNTAAVQKVRRSSRSSETWSERFERVARWCHEAGIRVGTSLQFGLGESLEHRIETLDLVARCYELGYIAPGCVALNVNAPYPGTEQWVELLHHEGDDMPEYRQRLTRHPAFETAHQFTRLPPDEIEELYELAAQRLGDAILSVDFAKHDSWRQRSLTYS